MNLMEAVKSKHIKVIYKAVLANFAYWTIDYRFVVTTKTQDLELNPRKLKTINYQKLGFGIESQEIENLWFRYSENQGDDIRSMNVQ